MATATRSDVELAEDRRVMAEQHCFLTVEDGAITKIDPDCTGLQPR